jgi:hypothetical protein
MTDNSTPDISELDESLLEVLNEAIKVVKRDHFGEELRLIPSQKIITGYCDGLSTSDLLFKLRRTRS